MRSFRCNQPPTRPEGAVKPREVCKQATWGLAKMPVYKRFSELQKLEVDAFDTIHNPVEVRHFQEFTAALSAAAKRFPSPGQPAASKTTTRTRGPRPYSVATLSVCSARS